MVYAIFQKFEAIKDYVNFKKDPLIALTVVIFLVTSFFLKTAILDVFSWFGKKFCVKKNISEDFEKDIEKIKKTTDQMVQGWIRMSKFMSQIQDDQSKFLSQIQDDQRNFVSRLENLFEVKSEVLENAALDDAFKRNDQRNAKIRRTNEDIQSVKISLRSPLSNSSSELNGMADDEHSTTESSTQTDREINGEARVDETSCSLEKNGSEIEYDTSKLVATVENCLTDLLRDAKLHVEIDREEEKKVLETIFENFAEDKNDIKKTILQAFSIGAEQAKANYNHFGQIGVKALKYIALLNDNTNTLLTEKQDETNDVLIRQAHDIDAVKEILESMRGEFGELFEKLAQIYQLNIEHSKVTALSLERTSGNWVQTVSIIEKMAKQVCDDTKDVKQIFKEIKSSQKEDADNGEKKEKSDTGDASESHIQIKTENQT